MRTRFPSKAFFGGLGAWLADLAGTFDEAPTTTATSAPLELLVRRARAMGAGRFHYDPHART